MSFKNTLSFLAVFVILSLALYGFQGSQLTTKNLAERLGYPAGTKLLIIHGDDIGAAHSVDQASFQALDKGFISSGSIMVPCSWFPEVAAYGKSHQTTDLGIHLTLTSEWDSYEWGPVAPSDQVKSLIDPNGYLWNTSEQAAANIKPEDAEREGRAQIDRALKAGIKITHLDSHMGTFFTPQLFPIYVKLAHEYRVPFFALRDPRLTPGMLQQLADSDLVLDDFKMAYAGVGADKWPDFYENLVRGLKPGVTLLIVHLGLNDSELQGVMTEKAPFGSAWRQRDFDVVSSARFAQILKDNNITLVGWKDLAAKAGSR
jgi:predicted glycoside hydrolase/deacetylase ChbG (UPF0249 family)